MNRSDLSFLEEMFQCKVADIKEQLIIVNQSKEAVLVSSYENIKVVNDSNFGLSRSRNRAMFSCEAKWAWILDDDVVLLPGAVKFLKKVLNENEQHCLTIVKAIDFSHNDRRTYPDQAGFLRTQKQIENISSIEMVIHVPTFKKLNLAFDERFGLGASFPMGEEYILVKDIIEHGEHIYFIPISLVQHDVFSSGKNPAYINAIKTRGALAAKYYPKFTFYFKIKYLFFLFRKGFVTDYKKLLEGYKVFSGAVRAYKSK